MGHHLRKEELVDGDKLTISDNNGELLLSVTAAGRHYQRNFPAGSETGDAPLEFSCKAHLITPAS